MEALSLKKLGPRSPFSLAHEAMVPYLQKQAEEDNLPETDALSTQLLKQVSLREKQIPSPTQFLSHGSEILL